MTYIASIMFGWFLLAALVPLTSAQAADNVCSITDADLREIGVWSNSDAERNELTELEIEGFCLDGEVVYRARAYTECSPRDCKWGWSHGARDFSGVLHFSFGGFFKSLNMEVRPMGKRMQAYVHTESRDTGIPSRTKSFVLTRDD